MNANANNRMGRLRQFAAARAGERGQAPGWDERCRMYGWKPSRRSHVPPAKSIKGRRSSKGSGSGGRGSRH